MVKLPIDDAALRVDLLVQRQAAIAHRQRDTQQMQRLILLQVTQVDDGQRLGDTGEQQFDGPLWIVKYRILAGAANGDPGLRLMPPDRLRAPNLGRPPDPAPLRTCAVAPHPSE